MPDNKALQVYKTRLTEDYILDQLDQITRSDSFRDHKDRISRNIEVYNGNITALFPDETALPDEPLVENKFKNALHDMSSLAAEARGMPKFLPRGDSVDDLVEARIRESIADTLWIMSDARDQERKMYMDMLGSGFVAISVFFNDKSDYPQILRLNPMYCYPDVRNGKLQDLLYVERLKNRVLARMFPAWGESHANDTGESTLVTYYDEEEVVTAIAVKDSSTKTASAEFVDHWKHGLGCVPVGFVSLDSWDDQFRGKFDQLAGPIMIRNKIVRLLTDYIEDMAHSPFEIKNMLKPLDEPGPTALYEHDPNAEPGDSFIRRVAPGAPSNSIFALLSYVGEQESQEAIQPPARVGNVQQAIASGNFVNSTQGTLSTAVVELQDCMARLRQQIGYIMFKIEENELNFKKPLVRAVGNKATYKPTSDIKGEYTHRVVYGATSGLRPIDADVRVLQHLGAKLISKDTAREQIDYLSDMISEQDKIDREGLAEIIFQRFASSQDPEALALTALVFLQMEKGLTLIESIKAVAPDLVEYARRAAQQKVAGEQPAGAPLAEGTPPAEEAASLQAGGQLPAAAPFEPELGPAPMQQQIVRNPL